MNSYFVTISFGIFFEDKNTEQSLMRLKDKSMLKQHKDATWLKGKEGRR